MLTYVVDFITEIQPFVLAPKLHSYGDMELSTEEVRIEKGLIQTSVTRDYFS